jgi:flagellar biosynthesis/type III secretory pathway chaperone
MNHQLQSELFKILTFEIEQTDRLLEILKKEKHAIIKDPDTLVHITEEKQAAIDSLNQAAETQNKLLESAGVSIDEQGIQTFINACSKQKTLTEAWGKLKHNLAKCQDQNIVNGAIMEVNRIRIQQTLSILLGGNNSQTYNAGGKNQNDSPNGSVSVKA